MPQDNTKKRPPSLGEALARLHANATSDICKSYGGATISFADIKLLDDFILKYTLSPEQALWLFERNKMMPQTPEMWPEIREKLLNVAGAQHGEE